MLWVLISTSNEYHNMFLWRINPCHAEWTKMPCPFLIFGQLDYLIQSVDINSPTEWTKMPCPFLIFGQLDYLIQSVDINSPT